MLSQADMHYVLDNPFMNMPLSTLCAHPVDKIDDFDLSAVKQEPQTDPGYQQHDIPSVAAGVDVKCEATVTSPEAALTSLPPPQKGRRGRKPQLTAYGKVGEKLEKRREQNRRAAATYREKQRRKKLSVEQTYYKLEADNARKQEENRRLRLQVRRLQAQLSEHAYDGTCKKQQRRKTDPPGLNQAVLFATAATPPAPAMSAPPAAMTSLASPTVFTTQGYVPNSMLPPAPFALASTSGTQQPQTQDQSLALSPFTPKTNNDQPMFAFDTGFDASKQRAMMTSPYSAHSPASVQSVSPRPSSLMSEMHYPLAPSVGSMSLQPGNNSDLDLSFVLSNAQQTLTQPSQVPIIDAHYHSAVDEFLSEQNC